MFGESDDNHDFFIVSVKEDNMRKPETILFKVPSCGTLTCTKELIYDYCDSNDMVILFIDQISKEYYNTHTNCREL